MATQLLTSQVIPILLRSLRERGANVDPLLNKFGLQHADELAFEVTLSVKAAIALSNEAAVMAGDPHFGLRAGATVQRGALGLIEFTIRAASTLRGGIEQMGRFSALFNGLVTLGLEETRHFARLTHRINNEPHGLGRQLNEFVMAALHRVALDVSGGHFALKRVQFAHPAGADMTVLKSVFGPSGFDFDMGENALVFDPTVLDRPPIEADAALSSMLQDQAQRVAEDRPRTNTVPALIRQAMIEELRHGMPTLRHVAKRLAMGERTLQRKLGAQHTSFADELDRVRESLAKTWVQQNDKTLAEVAYALRYSQLSAFSRAYKRWFGLTPSDARKHGRSPT